MTTSVSNTTEEIKRMIASIERHCTCVKNDSGKVVWECDLHHMLRIDPNSVKRFFELSGKREKLIDEEMSGPYAGRGD